MAAGERVSPAAMSKLVSRLERDGLIERTPSETDRRRVGLKLTAEGHRTLRRVRSRRTAWLATRLQELDAGGAGGDRGSGRARSRASSRSAGVAA